MKIKQATFRPFLVLRTGIDSIKVKAGVANIAGYGAIEIPEKEFDDIPNGYHTVAVQETWTLSRNLGVWETTLNGFGEFYTVELSPSFEYVLGKSEAQAASPPDPEENVLTVVQEENSLICFSFVISIYKTDDGISFINEDQETSLSKKWLDIPYSNPFYTPGNYD